MSSHWFVMPVFKANGFKIKGVYLCKQLDSTIHQVRTGHHNQLVNALQNTHQLAQWHDQADCCILRSQSGMESHNVPFRA